MTKSSKQELKTKKKYNQLPDVQKKRVENNRRRREAERNNLVKKGDGKHIDHKKPLSKGRNNKRSNLKLVKPSGAIVYLDTTSLVFCVKLRFVCEYSSGCGCGC